MYYYGFAYKGYGAVYSTENAIQCNDPYEALIIANQEWEADSDHIGRLLVVIEVAPQENYSSETKAYFQFTSEKACADYVAQKGEIKWSEEDDPKWNGDAHMMT